MTLYAYRAIDAQGKARKGLQDAANLVDLESHLKRMGLDLIDAHSDRVRRKRTAIPAPDLITLFFNLEQLTRSGVPLLTCLEDLRDTMHEPHLRTILAEIIASIQNGKTLSQSMQSHPEAFDATLVSLTHAGEISGRIDEVFAHITTTLKWQDEMRSHTKMLLMYPALVGSVVIAVIAFLLMYLVPQLVVFIQNMGQEIPMQTRVLLWVSAVFVQYWAILLGVLVGAFVLVAWLLHRYPELHETLDDYKLRLWIVGDILRKLILARFANTFALMYRSGISVLDCLANSEGLVNNHAIARSLQAVAREIEAGHNLTDSFAKTNMFPPLVIRMLSVGETTGALDEALLNISYFYERDAKAALQKMQMLIEPAMTLILGALLGWVMLSVLAPIYELIGKLKL